MSPFRLRPASAVLARGGMLLWFALASIGHACTSLASGARKLQLLDRLQQHPQQEALLPGRQQSVGHTDLDIWTLSGSYSPTDRIWIERVITVREVQYRGPGLGGHDTTIDDGTWHSTITDLQFTVNYQLVSGAFGLAPYVGAVIPTHDYTTSATRRLAADWMRSGWVPMRPSASTNGFRGPMSRCGETTHSSKKSQASLTTASMRRSRSAISSTRPGTSASSGSEQWTDGGINFPVPQDDPLFPVHDVLADEEFINVGGGATWVINERMSVYGLYMNSIEGSNTHKVDHRTIIGFSYGVGGH